MSGGAGTSWANHILDTLGQGYTPPANVYFALYAVAPTDAGGGTEFDGTTEPGYARAAVTNNATNFPNAASASKTTGANVTFAANSGASAWTAAIAWGIFDASTGGNLLIWGTMNAIACPAAAAITIPSGTTIATVA